MTQKQKARVYTAIAWLEKLKVFAEYGDGLYYFGNNDFTYVGNPTWDMSWLEKQGQVKEYTFKSIPRLLDMIEPSDRAKAYCQKLIDTLAKEGYNTDAKIVEEVLKGWNGEDVPMAVMDEKQGEQNLVNKVEPKFHKGDWVVFNDRHVSIYQVEKIENYEYTLRHFLGGSMLLSFSHEDMIRAWTIQDAKGGDVLVHNGITFIFKGIEDGIVKGLCSELSDSILNFGEPEHDKDYYPATKEQRDFLFQKMKEAGYEWDAEKKELKKIENRPMLSDFFNAEYERGKADALKSVEWSEEDEKNLVQCIEAIDAYYEWDSMIDWLKSLRSRSRWKPSEEQMYMLEWLTTNVLDDDVVGNKAKEVLYTLIEQLKSL